MNELKEQLRYLADKYETKDFIEADPKRTHPHIKTLDEMCESGDLCNYCSYMERGHYPGEICEGIYCEEAYDRYLTEIEEEE